MSMNASLVLVGSGIKFFSHLTTEAKIYIEQSAKVLYLVNEPAMKDWIRKANSNSESLDDLYTQYPLREDCYRAITEYILQNVRKNLHVCVVIYGHPTVAAQPGLDAVIHAKNEGFFTKILPGISAEACLFADLMIDPSSNGSQSFEATDFLFHQRRFDPTSNLILWQVGSIGVVGHENNQENNQGISLLVECLQKYYKLDHKITLYEAAQYPGLEPRIEKFLLSDLIHAKFSAISTLFIPPAYKAPYNPDILKKLKVN